MAEDEEVIYLDVSNSDEDDFEKSFREEAEAAAKKKDDLINAALKDGQITSQMAEFLKGIQSSTLGSSSANLHKVELILSMRDVLASKSIGERKTVYLYSGCDWRFPVALGAKDITMVDTGFSEGWLTTMLVDGVREYDPEMLQKNGEVNFEVDLGEGKEKIRLHLDSSDIASYTPTDRFDFVLESLGASGDSHRSPLPTTPSLAKSLADGALIYNDRYVHDIYFGPNLGLEDIGVRGQHFYEVTDSHKMVSASEEIARPAPPSLDKLREIVQRNKSSES